MAGMNWRSLTAFLLLLPMWQWCELPLWNTADLAEHQAIEGDHYHEICPHPSSPIDPPQQSATLGVPQDDAALQHPSFARLPPLHAAREHPPPLFYSLSHSLRAPPTLIPA
jgi:hypothetical protein